jgi:hypothetical protein
MLLAGESMSSNWPLFIAQRMPQAAKPTKMMAMGTKINSISIKN